MFFAIGPEPERNYSHFYTVGVFHISTDAGWHQHETANHWLLYKGYADLAPIQDMLTEIATQAEPYLLGNFCVLAFDKHRQTLKVCTDRYRGFPLYLSRSQGRLNNLSALDQTVWADGVVELDSDFDVTYTTFDVVGPVDDNPVSLNEMLDAVDSLLIKKTQQLKSHIQVPIKSYLSGGVDSLLVYSYLLRGRVDFELLRGEHIDYDEFWLKNSNQLKSYWAYTQIHHYRDPCVITSGTPGDEYMLRSPTTSNLWLMSHGTSIPELLGQAQWQRTYHHAYFSKQKNLDLFQSQQDANPFAEPKSKTQVIQMLCNMLTNDWQHYHLGHTLTWTPLRDLEIIKLFLRLPLEIQKTQIMNASISRRLIEHNCPGLTAIMSDQKNTDNLFKNMVDFYADH